MATRFELWRIGPITVSSGRCSLDQSGPQQKTAKPEKSYVRLPLSSGGSAGRLQSWGIHEAQSVGWLVAPNLMVVSACIAAAIFDPVLLETGTAGKIQHPVIAATFLILSLLFAATRLSFLAIGWLPLFVTDPRRYFKK